MLCSPCTQAECMGCTACCGAYSPCSKLDNQMLLCAHASFIVLRKLEDRYQGQLAKHTLPAPLTAQVPSTALADVQWLR